MSVGTASTEAAAPPAEVAPPAEAASRTGNAVRRRARRTRLLVLLTQLALLAVLLGLWEYATYADRQAAFMFGRPTAIFGFLVTMASDGSLFRDTWVTGMETVLGFVVGNVLGTVLGLALWYSPFVSRVVSPFVVALGSIPIIALAPMVIIWFGTGLASKIAMATLSVVVVALVTSYKGATSVDPDQINLMRTLGARKWQIFNRLVVPASLTDIFAGLKLTVGFALIGAIIGEFMSSSEGLGHAIFKAGSLYIIPKVLASLVATIALALALTFVVGKLEKRLMPWRRDL
ncbi:ABC transporter permease [Acuticoccus yangtzensis]|uniref:ABC transporter permease n=1 Tax=Acuticoccus yangtzensis TaxID=1443441 RepID=UPI0009496514|nr:ABC transporter permease [Acuticoccus yangtzensis]